MDDFLHSPVLPVLAVNGMWLAVCAVWAILCFAQARRDRANRTGFQKPVGPHEID
ncbi:MAG: hypothetical protein SGJ11_09215 [Phycisphaerae bacterium]|nr:hypothetical protein [Phycisphaerae bacterium]